VKTINVQYRYYSRILTKLEFSRQIVEESLNIKFHQNPSSGKRVVPCGWKEDGRAYMIKLIVDFSNSANAPEMQEQISPFLQA
jgi:hypothetical protein